MLQSNGFSIPEIIALGEKRIGLCCSKTFVMTAELKTAQPIYQVVAHIGREPSEQSQVERKEFFISFGRVVGRMHNAKIFHGDLRLGNILAERVRDGWQFFFIDNERTKRHFHLPLKLRLKNLVQLNMIGNSVSERDRMRFFSSYMAQNTSMQSKRDALISAVREKTARRKGL